MGGEEEEEIFFFLFTVPEVECADHKAQLQQLVDGRRDDGVVHGTSERSIRVGDYCSLFPTAGCTSRTAFVGRRNLMVGGMMVSFLEKTKMRRRWWSWWWWRWWMVDSAVQGKAVC